MLSLDKCYHLSLTLGPGLFCSPKVNRQTKDRNMSETHLPSVCAQSHLILCDPMDCSLPGSSVHGIFPARILEWVAIYSSKGSSQPGDQTHISFIASSFFTCWTIRRGQSWRAWQQFHCQLLSLCYSRNEKVTPHLWWISPSPKPGREWAAGYCPTQGKTCFEKKNSN